MSVVKYEEFEISAVTRQLPSTGEWTLAVVLTKHHDGRGETLSKQFSSTNTFKTKVKATSHSIEFGRQIIDRQHPSISDLATP